jgi:hypothetical protein
MEDIKTKEQANLEVEKFLSESKENLDLDRIAEMVKNNKFSWDYNGKKYKIELLTLSEKEELDTLKSKKLYDLLADPNIKMEKEWRKIYKEKGVDLDSIDEEIKKALIERENFNLKLGEVLTKSASDSILNTYKENILALNEDVSVLDLQKQTMLAYTLENKLIEYTGKVITYLSLKVLNQDKWEKAFKNIEEFEGCQDEKLLKQAFYTAMLIQYR